MKQYYLTSDLVNEVIKMPNSKFDHITCCGKVCLLCLQKPKPKQKKEITERVKHLIESNALPKYSQYCDLPSFPKVICGKCLKRIEGRSKGTKTTVTVPRISKFIQNHMPTGECSFVLYQHYSISGPSCMNFSHSGRSHMTSAKFS